MSVGRIHLNHPENGSGIFLRNVGKLLPDTTEKTIWISASSQLVTYVIPQRHILNNSTTTTTTTSSSSGLGSSVGIATDYGLDGPEIESRWGRDFPPVQTRPGRDADHSPPSIAEVLEE